MENIVFGWDSLEKAAADIYNGVHDRLLEGSPVFLYRNNSTNKSELLQVVVVHNCDYENKCYTDYGVGIITTGWTALYPHIPYEYLETDLLEDLKKYKVEKNIIDIYKQIISRLKNEKQ